jgi:hypothetical protein
LILLIKSFSQLSFFKKEKRKMPFFLGVFLRNVITLQKKALTDIFSPPLKRREVGEALEHILVFLGPLVGLYQWLKGKRILSRVRRNLQAHPSM